MRQIEIAIIGGGPAGSYCAYLMAEKGNKPVIFDHSHPREKPCGGNISTQTITRFPFIEQYRQYGQSQKTLKIITYNKKEYEVSPKKPGFNISREILDQQILKKAHDSGAEIIEEKVISIKHPKRKHWIIETNNRTAEAKILIGADGANSIVRKKTIGPIRKEDLALTYGYLVTGVENLPTTVKYPAEIPGYIWLFPRGNNSCIGIGSYSKYGRRLKRILDNFINEYCNYIKITSEFAALLPWATDPKFFDYSCSGRDWFLVGDAAGHVDPISGEGILYALWSAQLTAEAINKNQFMNYDVQWRREYGNHLVELCKQKQIFYNPITIEIASAKLYARNQVPTISPDLSDREPK